MNRSEAIATVARRLAVPVDQVESVVTEFFEVVSETLEKGETLAVRRFGKFEPRLRRAMRKPHPATGALMDIPERLSVQFLPSELLKNRMNDAA